MIVNVVYNRLPNWDSGIIVQQLPTFLFIFETKAFLHYVIND